jgi:2'-5' RNA ligase
MSSLVIVAIPAEDEVVYKVSSEKVPHLTLMYLGETSEDHNVARMAQFVDHALTVNQHGPFHLSVDYRGELGEDKADVLFFEGGWDTKWIKSLRSQLLKQSDIRAAYEANDQFPDWVPHLTLGYPDSPAKPLPNDYGRIYGVQFDRIAVWDGEYEGPEFRLRWPERPEYEDEPALAAWSATVENLSEAGQELFLAHYGVKGMQWGVRRSKPIEGSTARGAFRNATNMAKHGSPGLLKKVALMGPFSLFSPSIRAELKTMDKNVKLAKADEKWDKGLKDGSAWVAVNNASATHFNKGIDAVNKKHPEDPKWGSEDPNSPTSPGYKKYMQDVNKLSADSIRAGVKELDMRNPSGTKEVEVIPGELGNFQLKVKQVKHAADDESINIKIDYQVDDKGLVTGFTYSDDEVDDTLEQSADLTEDTIEDTADDVVQQGAEVAGNILEHFGVKGMRWGVRKEDVASAAKAVGRAAEATGRFASDVHFEAKTMPNKDEEGNETSSDATAMVARAGEKEFRATDLPKINSKPEHVKAKKLTHRMLHPLEAQTKAYRKEVKEAYIQRMETTANSIKNASGTREYTIRERGGDLPGSKYGWEVSSRQARHADGDEDTIFLEVLMDKDGFITGTKQVPAEIKQAMDFAEDVLAHYGVKGMRWGQRKEHAQTGRKGERKDQGWLDPEGKDLATDVFKAVIWPMVPPLTLFSIPAHVRLVRGGARATGSKIADMDEKRFAARAQSEKNFTEIHNRAAKRINSEIGAIDKKYPGDLTKNPEAKKRYDADVLKATKSAYSDAAKSIGNKTSQNMRLEIEFKGNSDNFTIKAVEGRPTSQQKMRTQGIRHADDEELEFEVTLEFSGKIKRDATGHILNLDFDGIEQKAPVQHSLTTAELGELFIEHYGVKGMRWGVRNRREPLAVEPMARSRVPHGRKRKTKIEVEGGENHPAADDAVAVAEAAAKLKKSGTKALSNRELQQIANRIELEDRVARATRSKGNKFVRELLEGETKSIVRGGVQSVTGTGGGKKKKK